MGSFKDLYLNNVGSDPEFEKLWFDIPSLTTLTESDNKHEKRSAPVKRETAIRPTVATLLRHHSNIKRQEKQQKKKIQSIVEGRLGFDLEAQIQAREVEQDKRSQIEVAKKVLKARLSYHKAIAAAQQAAHEKHNKAQDVRCQIEQLREIAEVEKKIDLEHKKNLKSSILQSHADSKITVRHIQAQKQSQAQCLKQQISQLQQQARELEKEEMLSRREKIQQIQAGKQALRAANQTRNATGGIISAIGSPDTEIRLRLSKEIQKTELEEKRRQIEETRKRKFTKLEKIQESLRKQQEVNCHTKQIKEYFGPMPPIHPRSDLLDNEVLELQKELEKYKFGEVGLDDTGRTGNRSRTKWNNKQPDSLQT